MKAGISASADKNAKKVNSLMSPSPQKKSGVKINENQMFAKMSDLKSPRNN